MKISLQESMRKSIFRNLDFSFTPEAEYSENENFEFTEPVRVTGTVRALSGIVDLKAHAETKMRFSCSRCLDSYEREISLDVDERLSRETEEDDFDTIQLSEGDTVDLTDILTKDIISSLPIQTLCSEDCRGLCQECGANLNRETCDCDREQVDMRLEALRDLF